jgi:hypothetical protein
MRGGLRPSRLNLENRKREESKIRERALP